MDMYRELILDHYKHPRNAGHLDHPDTIQSDQNVSCGDSIIMEVSFDTVEGKRVLSDVRFSGSGCAINQASASMLTEKAKGKSLEEIQSYTTDDILELLGTQLTPTRIKCAVLPLEVLQKAIRIS
jgi:nitrogen fixation NifU-like protein